MVLKRVFCHILPVLLYSAKFYYILPIGQVEYNGGRDGGRVQSVIKRSRDRYNYMEVLSLSCIPPIPILILFILLNYIYKIDKLCFKYKIGVKLNISRLE